MLAVLRDADSADALGRARERRTRPAAVDVRLRDPVRPARVTYSPTFFRHIASAYSRFNFAMKLALISAGQTASHS